MISACVLAIFFVASVYALVAGVVYGGWVSGVAVCVCVYVCVGGGGGVGWGGWLSQYSRHFSGRAGS